MARLPETSNAFAEVVANTSFGIGDHQTQVIEVGANGLQLGYEPFDPRRHQPHQIDPLAPFADTFGEQHVKLVRPERALTINVVNDLLPVDENPVVTEVRRDLAADIGESLSQALPGIMDYVYQYAIVQDRPKEKNLDVEVINVANAGEAAQAIKSISVDGPTFVISGFHNLRLAVGHGQNELVAVKVNHPWDRRIPHGVGRISLQGLAEVNTRKPKEIEAVNTALSDRHEKIVGQLEASGAVVASVIARPQSEHGYDIDEADQQIAKAIRKVSRQKP